MTGLKWRFDQGILRCLTPGKMSKNPLKMRPLAIYSLYTTTNRKHT